MATVVGRVRSPEGSDSLAVSSRALVTTSEAEPRMSFNHFLRCVKDASPKPWITLGSNAKREQYEAQKILEKVYHTGYVSNSSSSVKKTAMGEASGTVGGYIVPRDFTYALMEALTEDSFILPRAYQVPMESAQVDAPYIDVETTPSAVGQTAIFGGVSFVWGLEDAPIETEPKFRQLTLNAWDLLGYAILSNQFLADTGPAGEQALIRLFGRAAAWYAEYAFFQGLGAGSQMPLGILKSPCLATVSRAVASQIAAADIAGMAAKLLPASWSRAIWATNPSCLGQLVKVSSFLLNAASDQGSQEQKAGAGAIVGRPLYVTEKLPILGSIGDIVFFDPYLYIIGMRQEIIIDISEHSLFRTNQSVFRIWMRVDGRPMISGPVTLQDGTTRVSPFVALTA